MVLDCLKPSSHSHSWTRNSFPGGKSCSPSMLFGPVLGTPYMGAPALPPMTFPASTPMVVPMQIAAPVQTGYIPVPVTVQQQPSPVVQVLPPPVIQVTPSPVVPALPRTYTVHQTPQPVPHVPSPVIHNSIPVPQPSPPQVGQSIPHDHYRDQQQQGSPGRYTVNLFVNTPEHRSRQLDDGSPSPAQLWEQQHQWQQEQEQRRLEFQDQQVSQQHQWQEHQQQLLRAWQHQQLQQRGRPQSARPPTSQPPTPSSLNIHISGPHPRHPESIYIQTPTPPPVN